MKIETWRERHLAKRAATRELQREAALANRKRGPQPVYLCCFNEAHLPEGHHGLDCDRPR